MYGNIRNFKTSVDFNKVVNVKFKSRINYWRNKIYPEPSIREIMQKVLLLFLFAKLAFG